MMDKPPLSLVLGTQVTLGETQIASHLSSEHAVGGPTQTSRLALKSPAPKGDEHRQLTAVTRLGIKPLWRAP